MFTNKYIYKRRQKQRPPLLEVVIVKIANIHFYFINQYNHGTLQQLGMCIWCLLCLITHKIHRRHQRRKTENRTREPRKTGSTISYHSGFRRRCPWFGSEGQKKHCCVQDERDILLTSNILRVRPAQYANTCHAWRHSDNCFGWEHLDHFFDFSPPPIWSSMTLLRLSMDSIDFIDVFF